MPVGRPGRGCVENLWDTACAAIGPAHAPLLSSEKLLARGDRVIAQLRVGGGELRLLERPESLQAAPGRLDLRVSRGRLDHETQRSVRQAAAQHRERS
eukprot:4782289-Prymnesium_polylepis.2